ncbi:MAG TPA: RagB/SusD family nutrient uptake outer membrane protein [Myxococcaceae bacterium]|jgi:hypothetical protein
MKKTALMALCASSLGLGACGLDIPDLNNPSRESIVETPTPSSVKAASTGLLIGNRAGKSASNGYVSQLGVLGRESYTLDPQDPRAVSEMLSGTQLDPGSPAFGGNYWTGPYLNIRNANTLIASLDKVTGFTEAELESIRGFAKTIQALEFLTIVSTRDTNGGPIDVGGDIRTLAPIESKERMLEHISMLLDEAKTHLEAAGEDKNQDGAEDEFPFPLSSGYTGFKTPTTFLKFTRAVKARNEAYRKNWPGVLSALSESFLDTTNLDLAKLSVGVYHAYGTGSGDTTNGLTSPNIYAHPSIVEDAQTKFSCNEPAGPFRCLDNRVQRKIKQVQAVQVQDLESPYAFTMYSTGTSPLPIIRNEELILLRAEANINIGTNEALVAAGQDINLIRAVSGGLPPVDLVGENAVDTLLYERRYSLLFEGGHRWIDMRRYSRLNQLPRDREDDVVHDKFPIPLAETDARR